MIDNIFFYSVGYYSYEDSGYIALMHEQQFSEEEFNGMVVACSDAVAQRAKEHFEREEDFGFRGYYNSFDEIIHINFSHIYEEIVNEMCLQYNFIQVKYQAGFSLFGWPNFNVEKDWDYEDEMYVKISKIFRDALKDIKIHPSHIRDV